MSWIASTSFRTFVAYPIVYAARVKRWIQGIL